MVILGHWSTINLTSFPRFLGTRGRATLRQRPGLLPSEACTVGTRALSGGDETLEVWDTQGWGKSVARRYHGFSGYTIGGMEVLKLVYIYASFWGQGVLVHVYYFYVFIERLIIIELATIYGGLRSGREIQFLTYCHLSFFRRTRLSPVGRALQSPE